MPQTPTFSTGYYYYPAWHFTSLKFQSFQEFAASSGPCSVTSVCERLSLWSVIWTNCTTVFRSFSGGIFAFSLTVGETLSKLNVFFWFGMGFGLSLLALSFLAGPAQRWITHQFALHARLINLLSRALLISVGVYDLISNWELFQIFPT